MSSLRVAIRELWGLFVEDASFTIAIAACLGVAYFVFPAIAIPNQWKGLALFVLLAIGLLENVWRNARP